jgi:hypothetical protein
MRSRGLVFAFALAFAPVFGTKPHAAVAEPPFASLAAAPVPRGPLALTVGPARDLAAERLGHAACRGIFEELADFTGRPAARRLAQAGRSPSSHFARLRFVASAEGPCMEDVVAAWSVAGDPRVRVCPRVFAMVAGHDRREAAALLIHEALHTLGVAENAAGGPLTQYVRRRCGL